jgi:hypothetical protein
MKWEAGDERSYVGYETARRHTIPSKTQKDAGEGNKGELEKERLE